MITNKHTRLSCRKLLNMFTVYFTAIFSIFALYLVFGAIPLNQKGDTSTLNLDIYGEVLPLLGPVFVSSIALLFYIFQLLNSHARYHSRMTDLIGTRAAILEASGGKLGPALELLNATSTSEEVAETSSLYEKALDTVGKNGDISANFRSVRLTTQDCLNLQLRPDRFLSAWSEKRQGRVYNSRPAWSRGSARRSVRRCVVCWGG